MANFLELARAGGTYQPGGLHSALGLIAETYFGSSTAPNIEDLANLLVVDVGSDPRKDQEQRKLAYDQLLSVICETLEKTYDKPRSTAVRDLFVAVGNW